MSVTYPSLGTGLAVHWFKCRMPLLPHAYFPDIFVACEVVERMNLGVRLSTTTFKLSDPTMSKMLTSIFHATAVWTEVCGKT